MKKILHHGLEKRADALDFLNYEHFMPAMGKIEGVKFLCGDHGNLLRRIFYGDIERAYWHFDKQAVLLEHLTYHNPIRLFEPQTKRFELYAYGESEEIKRVDKIIRGQIEDWSAMIDYDLSTIKIGEKRFLV